MFLKGFLSNSSPSKGFPVFGLIGGNVGFFTPPAPGEIEKESDIE